MKLTQELLRHRGPDWNGIFDSKNAILSHERLAIVDPTSGKQPLYSQNNDIVLAANGEIYNQYGDYIGRLSGFISVLLLILMIVIQLLHQAISVEDIDFIQAM